MSGRWVLIQTNNTAVSLNLEPSANGFAGQASFGHWVKDDFFLCNIGSCAGDVVNISGPAVGKINGNSFELTVYWSDNAIGVYNGQVGPQGLIVGTTFDKNNPQSTAQWHSNRVAACSANAAPPARSGLALGRVPHIGPASPPVSLCDAAKSARARNSPTAPALEKRCAEQSTRSAAAPTVAFARVPTTGPAPAICDAARTALARGSPAAPGLRRQCDAFLAANQPPAPVNAPTERYPPVQKPNDLVIGRIAYEQGGQRVTQPVVGTPIAISCTYFVNEVSSFVYKIHPWRGVIQVGGQVPQTLEFQGDQQSGQHEARQFWTPAAAAQTPISCALNPGFEGSEAYPGNNRFNETIDVVAGDGAPPQAAPPAQ